MTLRQRIVYGDEGDRRGCRASAQPARAGPSRTTTRPGLATVESTSTSRATCSGVRPPGDRRSADCSRCTQQAGADGWEVMPFAVDWDAARPTARPHRLPHHDRLRRAEPDHPPRVASATSRADGARSSRATTRPAGWSRCGSTATVYVERIAYDAKGQRTLIAYGNGLLTRYAYDPRTFRLARLRTEPYAPDGATYRPTGPPLQDHGYDLRPGRQHPRHPGPHAGQRHHQHRGGHRRARPRLHLRPDLPPGRRDRPGMRPAARLAVRRPPARRRPDPHPRRTTETYTYDRMGSLRGWRTAPVPAGFARRFEMVSGCNRLARMTIGGARFELRLRQRRQHDHRGDDAALRPGTTPTNSSRSPPRPRVLSRPCTPSTSTTPPASG